MTQDFPVSPAIRRAHMAFVARFSCSSHGDCRMPLG
jgi:hypothetical protein